MCKIRAVHISRQKMSALEEKSDLYGFKSEKSVQEQVVVVVDGCN